MSRGLGDVYKRQALNWPLEDSSDMTTQYRELRSLIAKLVELVAGPEGEQD